MTPWPVQVLVCALWHMGNHRFEDSQYMRSDSSHRQIRPETTRAVRTWRTVVRRLATVALVVGGSTASAALVSATLPVSRSVQVGTTATLFATVINTATVDATGCRITPATPASADFFFQTTDPATNAVTGVRNAPVTIAAGQPQSFVLGLTPDAELAPTEVAFDFECDNVDAAVSIAGVNTLLLSASVDPVPDMIAIALTPSANGIMDLPGDDGLGFFSMASVNVGIEAPITISTRAPAGYQGALLVCPSDPVSGACLSAPAATATLTVATNATPTFAVFASSTPTIQLDPANQRLFVEFLDGSGALRGSTSVALTGGGIEPLFETVDGAVVLPDGPTTSQLDWIIGQLSESTTSAQDIEARFSPGAIAAIPVTQWQAFFDTLRTSYADGVVIDLVGVTPVQVTAVIADATRSVEGFLTLSTGYASGLITSFGVRGFGGTVQFPVDQTRSLQSAVDAFGDVAPRTSVLIAEIDAGNQCVPVIDAAASTPRATASIFKTWILGAVADAVAAGTVSGSDIIALSADEYALGGTINSEPLGTPFPVQDMATLMMGISDNTATDHLHELVGRAAVEATVRDFGHANPDLMTPLLGISEQFHLIFSFSQVDANAYINGSEAEQVTFLNDRIVPLGPQSGGAFFNENVLVDGSWMASPLDVCNAFAGLRRQPRASAAFQLVNRAFGAQAAQPDVREPWERVWYKGGSLATSRDLRVLTHAWMVESEARGTFAVVAMANHPTGNIDEFVVQSLTSRMLERVADL